MTATTDPPPFRIRAAVLDDAEAIATVHVRSWQAAYRDQVSQRVLDGLSVAERTQAWRGVLQAQSPGLRVWLAEAGPRVIGFATDGPSHDDDAPDGTGELYAIYVEPGRFGTGVGQALLRQATEDLQQRAFLRATLWVAEPDDRARRFYTAAGWRADGTRQVGPGIGYELSELRYARAL